MVNNVGMTHQYFCDALCIQATHNLEPKNGFQRFLVPVCYCKTVKKTITDRQLLCKWVYCNMQGVLQHAITGTDSTVTVATTRKVTHTHIQTNRHESITFFLDIITTTHLLLCLSGQRIPGAGDCPVCYPGSRI